MFGISELKAKGMIRLAAVAMLVALLLSVSWPAAAEESQPTSQATFNPAFVPIATGLALPVAITHAGDGSDRLFFTLQEGHIAVYENNQVLATPFLDITNLVSCCGEQGLLSVAFHPDYETNGFFYVNYTDATGGDTVIAQYSVSADPNVADPDSAVILLEIDQPFTNHNGGQLQFGPDGYLYIGMGDGGSFGDPGDRAQDLTELLGKMLRIDVDEAGGNAPDCGAPGVGYTVPASNPFNDGPGGDCDEIWAYGLRNPWRFSFDRLTGDLYIADVGQDSWEEVSLQPAGSLGGENYGWRLMEGPDCYDPPSNCNDGSLTLPILAYPHGTGVCAVIGGHVYRGSNVPQLQGQYLFADYCTGELFRARELPSGRWTARLLVDFAFALTAFGETEAGELCLTSYSASGTVYCLAP